MDRVWGAKLYNTIQVNLDGVSCRDIGGGDVIPHLDAHAVGAETTGLAVIEKRTAFDLNMITGSRGAIYSNVQVLMEAAVSKIYIFNRAIPGIPRLTYCHPDSTFTVTCIDIYDRHMAV